MILDLFADEKQSIQLAPGAALLEGFALPDEAEMLAAINSVIDAAPLRHMVTQRGYSMSVAMTNCGNAGWVSDRKGYRYERNDPQTDKPWPEMPQKIPLWHGDVFVFGGQSRMAFHGVAPLKEGIHPLLEARRINLTFRKAL